MHEIGAGHITAARADVSRPATIPRGSRRAQNGPAAFVRGSAAGGEAARRRPRGACALSIEIRP